MDVTGEQLKAAEIERKRIYGLPLSDHIKQSFCGECRPGMNFDCCSECRKNKGYYGRNEKKKRFTKVEIDEIESNWNKQRGFLRDDGCAFKGKRKLMSEICLRTICNKYRSRKIERFV